jgi:hypothetical protein
VRALLSKTGEWVKYASPSATVPLIDRSPDSLIVEAPNAEIAALRFRRDTSLEEDATFENPLRVNHFGSPEADLQ